MLYHHLFRIVTMNDRTNPTAAAIVVVVIGIIFAVVVLGGGGHAQANGDNPVVEENVIVPDEDDPVANTIEEAHDKQSQVYVIYDEVAGSVCYYYTSTNNMAGGIRRFYKSGLSCFPIEESRYNKSDFK